MNQYYNYKIFIDKRVIYKLNNKNYIYINSWNLNKLLLLI